MSIFDKIPFVKKKDFDDDLGLGNDLGLQQPSPDPLAQPYQPEPFPEPTPFQRPQQQFQQSSSTQQSQNKDFEVISAKLDALRAMLESISHRLETLEQQQYEVPRRRQW